MPIREYAGLLCDETPWTGLRYAYDPEDSRWKTRLFVANLQVGDKTMIAHMDTPAGVQQLWQHGFIGPSGMVWGMAPAIGRVTKMGFSGKALMGEVALSEEAVAAMAAGGLDDVEAGINSGFSVGLKFLDNPAVTWEMGDGTREKPDRMIVGATRVLENSLTPMPRLYTAGIHKRLTADPVGGGDMTDAEKAEAGASAPATAAAGQHQSQLSGGVDMVLDCRVPLFSKTGAARVVAAERNFLTCF